MKCYFCDKEACAKIGDSKGSILSALLGKKCWQKSEIYVCRKHFMANEVENSRKEKFKDFKPKWWMIVNGRGKEVRCE